MRSDAVTCRVASDLRTFPAIAKSYDCILADSRSPIGFLIDLTCTLDGNVREGYSRRMPSSRLSLELPRLTVLVVENSEDALRPSRWLCSVTAAKLWSRRLGPRRCCSPRSVPWMLCF